MRTSSDASVVPKTKTLCTPLYTYYTVLWKRMIGHVIQSASSANTIVLCQWRFKLSLEPVVHHIWCPPWILVCKFCSCWVMAVLHSQLNHRSQVCCLMLSTCILLDILGGMAAPAFDQCTKSGYHYDIFLDCMIPISVYGQCQNNALLEEFTGLCVWMYLLVFIGDVNHFGKLENSPNIGQHLQSLIPKMAEDSSHHLGPCYGILALR